MTQELIGERLRIVRSLRDRTQEQMGRPAQLTKEKVSLIESGKREASFHEMVCFACYLCISLDAFHRTRADGQWDISACLLPYTPPLEYEDAPEG